MDFTDVDALLERWERVLGRPFPRIGIVSCDVCEGTGYVTEAQMRDFDAWAVARVDQVLAAVDAGEITL